MTQENVINATLLSAGTALITVGVAMLSTNLLYGILAVVVGVGVYAVREVLP
jgi:hypothetical protein